MACLTHISLLFISFACLIPQTAAFTQCYYPDGSIPVDYLWEPCVGKGHSSCCIPSEGDICQPNGSCWYPRSNNTFRGACTDRTWNDPACPKDLCVQGNEDTWAWNTPCAKNNTSPSKPDTYACGSVGSDNRKIQGLCPTTAQSLYYEFFVTTSTTASNTKPTRYTSPPPLDTSKYTVYTETYTAGVSAWIQTTTYTTTWESTITSELSISTATTRSVITSQQVSGTGTANIADFTSLTVGTGQNNKGGITFSPGVLAAVIAGPIVGLGILAYLLFYFRARRKLKRGDAGDSQRLDSSAGPENGATGAAQVNPYEVPATEARSRPGTASAAGYCNTEKPQAFEKAGEGVYELSSVGGGDEKKGFLSPNVRVRETRNTSPRSQHAVNGNGVTSPVSPMSPASTYHSTDGGAVELDGGSWDVLPRPQVSRLAGSNRNGVGNA